MIFYRRFITRINILPYRRHCLPVYSSRIWMVDWTFSPPQVFCGTVYYMTRFTQGLPSIQYCDSYDGA